MKSVALRLSAVVVLAILVGVVWKVWGSRETGYVLDVGQGISEAQAEENSEFLNKYPQAVPFVEALGKTIKTLKERQEKGFKAVGVIQDRHEKPETPARVTLYTQGGRARIEFERGTKRYTVIDDGKTRVAMKDANERMPLPDAYRKPVKDTVALVPWFSDTLKWTSFEFGTEDKSAVGILTGYGPDGQIVVKMSREDPAKVVGLSIYTPGGVRKNEQRIVEHVEVDGLWLEKKLRSEHRVKQGKFVREVTMESYDFNWRPDEKTFAIPPASPSSQPAD